jgi:hypothetical protein
MMIRSLEFDRGKGSCDMHEKKSSSPGTSGLYQSQTDTTFCAASPKRSYPEHSPHP